MNTPNVFSVVFSVACAISLFLGIYIICLNPSSRTNRLFFVLSVALDFWAFGFSMAITADNLAIVLFWRRFSALGWGSFFSLLLHFLLVYTENDRFFSKWWKTLLLYIPAGITLLGFTWFPGINPGQYHMVSTSLGWVNVAVNNGWDLFYTVYFVIFSIAGFYLMWRWAQKSKNPRFKKQFYILLFSFALTMILGALIDLLGNLLFSVTIPQLGPLLMVFPFSVIYYTIKKHGLFNPHHITEDTILMTDQLRSKIINYMADAFFIGSLLNFITRYVIYGRENLASSLIFSISLALIGVLFQLIQHKIKNMGLKDILNAVMIAIVVPLITLRFIDFAGLTIWAFPFILLIITLIFGRSIIQTTLTISIILTQIIVWIIKPELSVKIDSIDHIFRIGIFALGIWFSFFVKKVYIAKLNENKAQIDTQKLITEISSDFVSVNESNLYEKMRKTLEKLGFFTMADRAYVYLIDNSRENLICRYFWLRKNNDRAAYDTGIISINSIPAIMRYLQDGNILAPDDIGDMNAEIGVELPRLIDSEEKSFVAMPIIVHDVFYGFFGIDTLSKSKKWHENQLGFFKIILNIFADAFERVNREKEINFMAYYDHLTKLPNRLLFKDRVAQSIHLSMRTNKIVSIIFLDLDAFKSVNDSIGHDGGDKLIIKVSEKLSGLLRKSDAISRFGGDEFLIMLNNLNSTNDIVRIAEKILSVFDKPFILNEQEFFVTASAGVAVYPYDGNDAETLIKNADIAMYKAKEQGKNNYLFCTTDMKDEILQKMTLSNGLYRALERHEFFLHYQPQVNAGTKKIIGAEALIRWNHPENGLIAPGLFIPLAEQTGLIGPIGDWVLRTACLQCRTWQICGLPDIRIAVNVSIIQLRNPGFAYRVKQILEEIHLEPRFLELEITESAAVNESDYIIEVLNGLKKLGISISIDDFGTEYSSLSRLTSMPIDRIKMDMQFVRGISKSEKEKAIAKGIIGLAHNLGLKVVAEGVETELQLNFLCDKECDEIQGFYFYHPVTSEDFERILREHD